MKTRSVKFLWLMFIGMASVDLIAAEQRYEAKDSFYSGGAVAEGKIVKNFGTSGARVIFSVNAIADNEYKATLHYSNPGTAASKVNVLINGLPSKELELKATGKGLKTIPLSLSLRSGLNSVALEPFSNGDKLAIEALGVAGGIALDPRGATLPYHEYEAEHGSTNADIASENRDYLSVAAESSGRRYVSLVATGHYVEWIAKQSTNALTIRYCIPDAESGGGTSASLSLYVNNKKVRSLALSSRFAWVYGKYPYDNNPKNGEPHHFFAESHFAGVDIPAGAVIRLQKDSEDTAAYYKIDLIDLEKIAPPYAMPNEFLSISDHGAIPNDGKDDTQAIIDTINTAKAKGKGIWIPSGVFTLTSKLTVDNVHIRGAGVWHSRLVGVNGQGGIFAKGGKLVIADLALASDSTYRRDAEDAAALEGNFGAGSLVQNIWIEHMKVGAWISAGTDGLLMLGGRMRDLWADGVNIAGGVKNSQVSQFTIRNTGDDAMAMWSMGSANINNSFRFNSAQLPALANTFAIYGGQDNKIVDNIGADTVYASAGIAISSRFNPAPFAGTTEVRRNTLIRTGGYEPTYKYNLAALWIFADEQPIDAHVLVDQLEIVQANHAGILLSKDRRLKQLTLSNVNINGAGGFGLLIDGVTGVGDVSGLVVKNAKDGGIKNTGFTLRRGEGNNGW